MSNPLPRAIVVRLLAGLSFDRLVYAQDKGRPLPKFGEWDVNDPATAEGFTVIFNKARDEKKTGGNARGSDSPGKDVRSYKEVYAAKPAKKWFCCIQSSPSQP